MAATSDMSSGVAKRGRPKGSKDGPRRPGAPPRGRPKKSVSKLSQGVFLYFLVYLHVLI